VEFLPAFQRTDLDPWDDGNAMPCACLQGSGHPSRGVVIGYGNHIHAETGCLGNQIYGSQTAI
jgi:hypothetical protein